MAAVSPLLFRAVVSGLTRCMLGQTAIELA